MQKKLFRILSVFLAVVIVSVCFMQPMAYANQVAIGGGLVLLVAGLLIMCGMTFSSQAQAESVAGYVISVAPPAILQPFIDELAGYIGGADPNGKKPTYQMYKNGFATAVSISSAAWIAFKMWFDEYFGVDEEVWNGGGGGVVVDTGASIWVTDTNGSDHELSIFDHEAGFGGADYASLNMSEVILWFDFKYDGSLYAITLDGGIASLNKNGVMQTVFGTEIGSPIYFNLNSYDGKRIYIVAYGKSGNIINSRTLQISNSGYNSQTTVGMLQAAWQEAQAYQGDSISIGITDDMAGMIEQPYSEIANADSLDDWDYKKDLEALRQLYDDVCADLGNYDDYDALLEQAQGLRDALDRANDAVYDGADVVGGVVPLDDAMYDAGKVLDKVKDMIDAQERDAEKIRALEDEIAKAKEKADELTKSGDKDIPTDPPITEGAKGKINWNILLNLFIFNKFPFSIPKDIYSFFDALSATPKEPVFVFDIFAGKFGPDAVIVFDFKDFEDIRKLVRSGVFIMLVVGLIAVTKKYIWK